MKNILTSTLLLLATAPLFARNKINADTLWIHEKLYLVKLTDNAWIHVSFLTKFECNGLILVKNNKAFLFDTPSYDSTTTKLVNYVNNEMGLHITGFATSDWHIDSQGGLGVINELGIPSYSNEMTRDIAKSKGLPYTTNGFQDSLKLQFETKTIELHYLGAAHTMDNIVAWIPEEQILFASCMVKELWQNHLGFTGDGDVHAYPETLKKVNEKFSSAKYIVPGHGKYGDIELVKHTLEVAKRIAAE